MTWLRYVLLVLVLGGYSGPLAADELRPAVVELAEHTPGQWSLEWKVPVTPTGQGEVAPLADPVLPQGCEPDGPPLRRATQRDLVGSVRLSCASDPAGQPFGLTGLEGRADAIARFVPLGRPVQTFRLTAAAPTAIIAAQPGRWAVARDYGRIGIGHILSGWDHLIFVVLLVLLVRRGWAVVGAVSAFTLAHSLTLAATTLGSTGLPSAPVEALIALSIVFLSVEVIRASRDPQSPTLTARAPWLVAFGFGLLHGFGFAGALAEIGLPQGEIAIALLAFNLGVEIGQVLVVGLAVALLWGLRRTAWRVQDPVIHAATYAMGITGSFWLFERVAAALIRGG